MEKAASCENDRIAFIQRQLQAGRTREELGAILGYKGWRSLDILMRRHGMKWDSKRNSYYTVKEPTDENDYGYGDSKVSTVISGFRQKEADPMEIALKTGFENHRQLSAYMDARGFIWSTAVNNYVKKPSSVENSEAEAPKESLADSEEGLTAFQYSDLDKYLPFLDILLKHKERLLDLVVPASAPGIVPRYTVPGITRTKSFYMSDLLSNLINEFSRCKNISQREIIETAVIEFLRKYSFKSQIDELLNRQ